MEDKFEFWVDKLYKMDPACPKLYKIISSKPKMERDKYEQLYLKKEKKIFYITSLAGITLIPNIFWIGAGVISRRSQGLPLLQQQVKKYIIGLLPCLNLSGLVLYYKYFANYPYINYLEEKHHLELQEEDNKNN